MLRSPIHLGQGSNGLVRVASAYADLEDEKFAQPPKLLVGMSVTHRRELDWTKISHKVPVIPVIVDTGYVGIFQIDERHLIKWGWIKDRSLTPVPQAGNNRTTRTSDDREFENRLANLWLHRGAYRGIGPDPNSKPMFLEQCHIVSVMKVTTAKAWPPFPLLGLSALIENNLALKVDVRRKTFQIKSVPRTFFIF